VRQFLVEVSVSLRSILIGMWAGRKVARGVEDGKELARERDAAGLDRLGFRDLIRRQYLWTDENGNRHVGWRVWFLLWLLPGLFALAAAWFALVSSLQGSSYVATQAVVSQVYVSEGSTPFDRGVMQYAPLLCYQWTDGTETCATPGQSHRDWNFEVGSRHEILYDPQTKRDVRLPGFANMWALPVVLCAIALGTGLIAAYGHLRVRRWHKGATRPG
jgi:hypothetical protein